MKALKIVGIVVGVVAIVASAGTLLAPAAAATATTAATAGGFLGMSAATLGTIATAATVAGAAISVGTALFAPKPTFSSQGNPLSFQTNPQSGLPYPIGRTRMSGVRIHADTYDAPTFKSESKQDILAFAALLGAGGPMEEIETFRADKETVTFDGSGNAIGTHANYMAQVVSLGLAGASALALTFGGVAFPGWSADHKLSGISHALWDLRYDPKGNHFGAGVPEPEWIGKWVKVYDPRLDSTYPGGSGTHRALDETTYEWSNNPPLHGLTWALGRWQNAKRTLGIGAPVENIRVAEFVEAANIADANGWTCGGVEWSTDSKWSILKRMLQAGGAEPTMTGAMIGCRVNMPRVSVATVTGDDLLDSLSIATTRSRRDRFNAVIPRYRSEDHDWQVISGTPVIVSAYVTEDGGQRTKEIDFPLVQAETGGTGDDQAGQLAAYEIVNSREAGPIRWTVGPKFIGVKTGDVVTLDVPDEGLDAQPVLVRSRSVDPSTFKITFEGETETDSKHAFALGQTTTPPPTYTPTPPDLTPPTPDAALWALTTSATADGVPSITVAGVCEFPGADTVLIEYRVVGAADWTTLGKFEASAPVTAFVSPVEGGEDFEARVAYQSGNRLGDWLDLAAVTTPAAVVNTQSAPVFIYQRAAAAPTLPSATTTYTFATGGLTGLNNGWSANPPAGTDQLWISKAIASGTGATDTIASGEWSAVAALDLGTLKARLSKNNIQVTSAVDGTVSSYTGVTGTFIIEDPAGTSITSGFTLSTGTNPQSLTMSYTGLTWSVTAGFDAAEVQATVEIVATGSGTYAGQVYRAVLTLIKDAPAVRAWISNGNEENYLVPDAPTITTQPGWGRTGQNGGADIYVGFSFPYNSSVTHKNNVDTYERVVRKSAIGSAWSGPGADPSNEKTLDWMMGPDMSTPATRYWIEDAAGEFFYSVAVRAVRYVHPNGSYPDGVVKGPWAVSTTPFRPYTTANITANINGEPAVNVATGVVAANAGLNSDGTVKLTRVLTGSIASNQIDLRGYSKRNATLGLATSDVGEDLFSGADVVLVGSVLDVTAYVPMQIKVTNPVNGTTYSMTAELMLRDVTVSADLYQHDTDPVITLTERWQQASASGTYPLSLIYMPLRHVFNGLISGRTYRPGYRLTTPSGNSGESVGLKVIQARNPRAAT